MKSSKPWLARALRLLDSSVGPLHSECNELDWKSALSPNKERLVEHLSAFANLAGGGFIVIGIDNATRQPCGMPQEAVDSAVTQLANLGRDGLEPPVRIDHAVVFWRDDNVLIVHVFEQTSKPVHRRGQSIEHAWIRSGGTTRKASRQEIGGFILNSRPPRWEELRASSLLPVEAILGRLDIDAICAKLGRPAPDSAEEVLRWLADEKMIDGEGDGGFVTNFGAIAAARDLKSFDSLARKRMRVVRYDGQNKVKTVDEVTGTVGYAVGFEGLIARLKRVLPHSEVIREALRADVAVYPEIALRELAANALIHQDFTISGTGPMIEIFGDRIEFTSPGLLLPGKSLDRLIGATPESRNEWLASAFRRYRICEERGTGFQKVVAAVELFGLPPIRVQAVENAFTVTLYAPRSFAEMSPSERIEACYQHAVLKYLSNAAMTNTSLRARLRVSEQKRTQVSNVIADAVRAGRIRRRDVNSGDKFAEYLPYWAGV